MPRKKSLYFEPYIEVSTFDARTKRSRKKRIKLDESTKVEEPVCPRNEIPAPDSADAGKPLPVHDQDDGPSASTEDQGAESDVTVHARRRQAEAQAWCELRNHIMSVRLEEFCPATRKCSVCGTDAAELVRCKDCGPRGFYCHSCDDRIHSVVFWHQSHVWFEDPGMYVPKNRNTILKRVDSHKCVSSSYSRPLVVFDTLGRHTVVTATFCGCEPECATLARYGLWPSSSKRPETAFTMQLMELCRAVQIEGQISLQKFCAALEGQQDFLLGQKQRPDLYRSLSKDALAEYRLHHQSLLERAIAPQTMARRCPICIQEPARSVISLDANFGLVHKNSRGKGVGLNYARHGCRIFSEDEDVHSFVENHSATKISSQDCSNFQAGDVLKAKNKSKKLDVNGVFGSVCQHGFPDHFVNLLHVGERFGYPVYILKKIVETWKLGSAKMTIMYDVACSFFAHLQKNAGTQNIKDCFKLVVPVFHSFAHSSNCQLTFGQRFVEGTGLVDGEGMERLWSYLRKFSGMTKEMSLPNRQDLLTDALLNYTRRNFYTTGQKLLVRLKRAKALQDSCLDLITKTELTEDGHVEEWLQRWKSNVQSRESTRITLSAEEQYCATLVLLEEKRQRLSSTDVIIQSDESTASIESLTKKAAKLQRDLRLEQAWSPCDSHVLEVANQAKAVKKAATLAKGKKLAVDRQHLLLNLRKYADGQKIASRLSRKMHENTQKLTVVLADLHDCGLHCALAEVKSVSSLLYKLPCPLSSEQIEAAKAFSEYERAKEEEESVLKDVQLFQSALLCLNRHLKDKIDQAKMSGGDSETAAGEGESSAGEDETSAPTVMQSLHLLHHSKFLLEMQIQSLRALFAQFTEAENESSIDKTVTKFLETSPVEESVQLYQSLLDNDLYLEAVDAIEDLDFSDISDQSDDDDDDGGGAS